MAVRYNPTTIKDAHINKLKQNQANLRTNTVLTGYIASIQVTFMSLVLASSEMSAKTMKFFASVAKLRPVKYQSRSHVVAGVKSLLAFSS